MRSNGQNNIAIGTNLKTTAGKIASISGACVAAAMAAILCCGPASAQRAQSDAVNAGVESSVQTAREQILHSHAGGIYHHQRLHPYYGRYGR
jgi:hypothetical protein